MDLPDDMTMIMQRLLLDMRMQCMSALFQKASEEIGSLYTLEDWVVDVDDSTGATTALVRVCDCFRNCFLHKYLPV